jgi:IS30 family transposase
MDYVRTKLNAKWSPQQIAGRLRYAEHRHNSSMWISHQTIYHFVAQDKAKGGKLFRHLRRGNKKFGKRGTGRHPNTFIRGRVSIDQRPPVVDQRLRVGDWEGDTFYGRHRKGCFCTLVERKTGFLATAIMPDASAQSLNDAVRQAFKDIPNSLVHTCTVDNGKEFARFKELEDQLDARFYFAHPYSAWERGLNENTNGLLRQFFPRKTDLTNVTPEQLTEVALCLNDRPRKRLNYRTPREALALSLYALDT